MTLLDKTKSIYLIILAFGLTLLYVSNGLSISFDEANMFFNSTGTLNFLTQSSVKLFGQNDIAFRLPFVIFYCLSGVLMYFITEKYFTKAQDRYLTVVIFMLLPGFNSAGLIANEAILVIFCTLLYIYLTEKLNRNCYTLLILFVLLDNSFIVMYLALFLYSVHIKDRVLFFVSIVLFGISFALFGFDTGGNPLGRFADTLGKYTSVLSPILFIYFFYNLYRIFIKEYKRDLLWYISFTALMFSLVASIRQNILIEDFAPFVVIAIPFMVKNFMHSLRIRLKQHQNLHKKLAYFAIFILLFSYFSVVFSKAYYVSIDDPSKHFASNYNFVKELSSKLKSQNIKKVICDDEKLQLRLKFYGIGYGGDYSLSQTNYLYTDKTITIKYYNQNVFKVYLKKINSMLLN